MEATNRPTIAEIVEQTRREQGLPPTVKDPEALREVAAILARVDR